MSAEGDTGPPRPGSVWLWLAPPAFAVLAGLWSLEHRGSGELRGDGSAERAPALVGEVLPPGDCELSGTLAAPGGGPGPSGVEVFLAREAWLSTHNPGAWRCCEGCTFGLFDEWCDRGAPVIARLEAEGRTEAHPSRIAVTSGGRFSFPLLPPGRYVVWAAAPKGTIAVAAGVTLEPGERRELRLSSRFRAALSGLVMSASEGTPVAGATIIALDPRTSSAHRALTGEDGRFSLTGLDPELTYHVSALADGLAPAGRAKSAAGDELLFELEELGSLAGTVSIGGEPAAGVKLELDELVAGAISDAEGKFRFARVSPGMHLVRAELARHDGSLRLGQRIEVEVARGQARKLELQLTPVCSLTVEVGDGEGPLASAHVRLYARGSIDHRVERTDDAGRAVFAMLPVGRYELEAARADRGRVTAQVDLGAGCATEPLRAVIPAGPGIRGRVVDELDRPIPGVELSVALASPSSDTADDVPRVTRTDDRGRFRVPSLPSGAWEVTATKAGFVTSLTALELEEPRGDPALRATPPALRGTDPDSARGREPREAPALRATPPALRGTDPDSARGAPPGEVELEILLSPGGEIRGTLADPEGHPVEGWTIRARRTGDEGPPAAVTRSGPGGRFSLPGLEPGEWEVGAEPPGSSARLTIESPETHAPDVRARTGQDLRVTTRGTGALSGTVRFVGAPPPESFAVGVPGIGIESFDGAAGRFDFAAAIAARYPILISAPGFSSVAVRAEVERGGSASLAVELYASARLSGRVVDARDGRPIPEAILIAMPAGEPADRGRRAGVEPGGPVTASSRRDGTFELGDLTPGPHTLNVQADGYARTQLGPLTVAPGHPADLEVQLARASARVAGRARRGAAPLLDALLLLERREPGEPFGGLEKARREASGSFVFESVEPGAHVLTIAAQSGDGGEICLRRVALTVPVAGTEGLELDLDARDRPGDHRLVVALTQPPAARPAPALLVTLRPGRVEPGRAAELDRARETCLAAKLPAVGQRDVLFDRLAPGLYTVSVSALEARDESLVGRVTAPLRTVVTRTVDVRSATTRLGLALD